jgi:hypothetical protein
MASTARSMEPIAVRTMTTRLALRPEPSSVSLVSRPMTVHARHFEVGDDDVGGPGPGFLPAFDAVARGLSAVAPAGDELGKAHESVGLVFDDEDLDGVLHGCSWRSIDEAGDQGQTAIRGSRSDSGVNLPP